MEYENYLKSEHWKSFKDSVYKSKRRRKCRICGNIKDLNIHHKKYTRFGESVLFNETKGTIMVLCKDCHSLWHKLISNHKIKAKYVDRIRNLMKLGYTKEQSFNNCYEGKYKILLNNIPAGRTMTAGSQRRS